MIEQGLFKRHHIGKDGFHWWIGQIPDAETWRENRGGTAIYSNNEQEGFGERFKVRIMGYHTTVASELTDEELPWASVVYPVTAGSGNVFSQTCNIKQGDFVYGFFLDGEDGQQPTIMGVIGYNEYQAVMKNVPDTKFVPFLGLDASEQTPVALLKAISSGTTLLQTGAKGQGTPVNSTVNTGNRVNTLSKLDEDTDGHSETRPQTIARPTSCDPLPLGRMQVQLRNAIQGIEDLRKSVYDIAEGANETLANIENEINKKIEEAARWIASAMKWVYEQVEKEVYKKIEKALDEVYNLAFPNERLTVKETSNTILDTIACFFRKLIDKLFDMMLGFIKSTIDRVINVPICFVEKFAGGVLGALSGIVDGLFSGLGDAISGVVGIVDAGLDLGGDILGMIDDIFSFLNCDDRPECSEINEWNIRNGAGPLEKGDITAVIDRAKGLATQTRQIGLDALNNAEELVDFDPQSLFSGLEECNTDPFKCGSPVLQLFGDGGAGAAGNLIIGAAGDIIGVDMISFGAGYGQNTRARAYDKCGNGRGAVLKPVFGSVPLDDDSPSGLIGIGVGGAGGNPDIRFGPFAPNLYPFPGAPDRAVSTAPFNPGGQVFDSPAYGIGPSFTRASPASNSGRIVGGELDLGNTCINVEFEVRRSAVQDNRIQFKLIQDEGEAYYGTGEVAFNFTGSDASGDEFVGAIKEIRCMEVGKDYLVTGYEEWGDPVRNPLKISDKQKTVSLDDTVRKTIVSEQIVERIIPGTPGTPGSSKATIQLEYEGVTGGFERDGDREIGFKDNDGSDRNTKLKILAGNAEFSQDGKSIIGSGEVRLELSWNDNINDAGLALSKVKFDVGGRHYELVQHDGGSYDKEDEEEVTFFIPTDPGTPGTDPRVVREVVKTETIDLFSDGDYLDLQVFVDKGTFRKDNGRVLFRVNDPGPTGPGPGPSVTTAPAPTGVGGPYTPPPIVYDNGGVGIIDVIVIESGTGFLSGPDGSTGGDGRTWAEVGDTVVKKPDGRWDIPIPPGNNYCVEAGSIVTLPLGTTVVTTTNDGKGGEETIIGGSPYVMQRAGCFTTPELVNVEQPPGDIYSIIMYLCEIIVINPGFGYTPGDKVIIEPDRGAVAEAVIDRYGRVTEVKVVETGEGFKELPKVYIQSETGYNAELRPKLCVDRVGDKTPDDDRIINVVDCVGLVADGYLDGKPYYGPYHEHNGRKMVGAEHSDSSHAYLDAANNRDFNTSQFIDEDQLNTFNSNPNVE